MVIETYGICNRGLLKISISGPLLTGMALILFSGVLQCTCEMLVSSDAQFLGIYSGLVKVNICLKKSDKLF